MDSFVFLAWMAEAFLALAENDFFQSLNRPLREDLLTTCFKSNLQPREAARLIDRIANAAKVADLNSGKIAARDLLWRRSSN